jgi:hypothetical protein
MDKNTIFDKLENYEQKPGVNYYAVSENVDRINRLWATYLLDKNHVMTGCFDEGKLMYLSLENNVSIESNPAFFLEGSSCNKWIIKPKIDLLERSFCLELVAQRDGSLLEGLNPEKLDGFALGLCLEDSIKNRWGVLTETCLKDPNTPVSQGELLSEDDARIDALYFLMGDTEDIKMRSVTREETLARYEVKLDLGSVKIEASEKNPILQYSDGECEVVLTKGQGKYGLETRKADLEYAGAELVPNYHDVVFSEASACLAFSKRCAELAKNAGRNDSAIFLVQRAAYIKAQEVLLGGRTGNGGESKTMLSPEKPKKKPKTMER